MSELDELIHTLCPEGVEFVKIKDISEVGTGNSNKNEAVENGLYPFFVRSKNVETMNSFEFDEEAIIIPGEGGIGEIFHYINGRYALHQRVYRIHFVTNRVNTKFVYYYMATKFKKFILKKAVSSTVTSIRKPMIEEFKIPIPPLKVQDEIVRILDKFTSLKEELKKELNARKKQYEYYATKLFLETNAEQIEMGKLAEFVYGYTDKAKNIGDVRFIRITDINENGMLKQNDEKYISLNDEARKSILKKGDLVMARTGATYGKTLYFNEDYPAVYASFLIKLIPNNEKLLNKYYWHFTKTSLYWEQANKLVTVGGQPQFNSPALKKIKIPIPSLEEQLRIVAILDKFDVYCNDLIQGLPAEIQARQKQYEYYRDKLLTFKEIEV